MGAAMFVKSEESTRHPNQLTKGRRNALILHHGREANSYDRVSLILQLFQVFPMFAGLAELVCPNSWLARLIAGLLLTALFWLTLLLHKKT